MPIIPVIENPRRKARRTLTAKQRAAGFGGKRAMSGTRRRRKTTTTKTKTRRRNPTRSTIGATPRRRRITRRRNPIGMGKLFGGLNLITATGIGAGILTAKVGPTLLQKVWAGAPTVGFTGKAVQVGTVLAVGQVVRMISGKTALATAIIAGGIGSVLYDLATEYILPRVGLAGLGAYYPTAPPALSGYYEGAAPGAGAMITEVDRSLAI